MKKTTIMIIILLILITLSTFMMAYYYFGVVSSISYKVISISNQDGTCQDLPNYLYDPEKGWNMVSESKYCNEVEEANLGCCSLRDKFQKLEKQEDECISLCKESGQCNCDLDFKTCDPKGKGWNWWKIASTCPESYPYIVYSP